MKTGGCQRGTSPYLSVPSALTNPKIYRDRGPLATAVCAAEYQITAVVAACFRLSDACVANANLLFTGTRPNVVPCTLYNSSGLGYSPKLLRAPPPQNHRV